ncbi:MAG: hypothetical protein WAT53_05980 [Nitrosomonas sp.]
MPARKVLGDQQSAQSVDKNTSLTLAAAADRNIEPRFPGSWIVSSMTPNEQFLIPVISGGDGIRINAKMPAGVCTEEIFLNKVLPNIQQFGDSVASTCLIIWLISWV